MTSQVIVDVILSSGTKARNLIQSCKPAQPEQYIQYIGVTLSTLIALTIQKMKMLKQEKIFQNYF